MDLVPKDDDSQFKIGDTNTLLSFTVLLNKQPVNLSTSELSMFQIKNSQGFIQSAKAVIEGDTATLNSIDLKNLPVGKYELELWHRNADGTNDIYPDEGWLPFTVNENATGTIGDKVTSVTLDQLSSQLSDQIKQEVQDAVNAIPKPKDGANGLNGHDGASSTITVGQVSELPPDSMTEVTDTGGKYDHILNFKFPKASVQVDKATYVSMDMYTKTGLYIGTGVGSDAPTENRYTLNVIADENGGSQFLIDIKDGRAWTRGFDGDTFTDWRQVTQWN